VLAGVLLPSATVFLLLLCNDEEVLGPWVNSRGMNIFTAAIIAVGDPSLVLTAGVLYPNLDAKVILYNPAGGAILALLAGRSSGLPALHRDHGQDDRQVAAPFMANAPARLARRPEAAAGQWIGLTVLRSYLLVAMIMVIFIIYQLAVGHK
jgi:hypothetical protein